MTVPIPSANTYGDFAGLQALKKAARDHAPGALREVAHAFESLFARMLIKSMRDAIGPNPLFGSDQERAYQQMYDDQLAVQITKGHGLGLADMLVRQLQRRGEVPGSTGSAPDANPSNDIGGLRTAPLGPDRSAAAPLVRHAQGHSLSPAPPSQSPAPQASAVAPVASLEPTSALTQPVSATQRRAFVHKLWPQACQAGAELGVAPQSLIAQAALETRWGCAVPLDGQGRSTHNLFGIKATGHWSGPAVTAATHEVEHGVARATTASFRAYGSTAQSFHDYVALLKKNPRYAGTLGTGTNVQAFAGALQRGGYATDPHYARQVEAVAEEVAGIASPLKSVRQVPIALNGQSAS